MRLSDFYSRIAPFLLGEASHPQAVESLYGQHAPSPDADRLAIYGRFCRLHRHETIEGVFSTLQKCLTRQLGEECWSSLIAAYFRAHPMHHFELNHNAAAFPQFLQTADLPSLLGDRQLPEFAAELADFEWWEWQTFTAKDDEADRDLDGGALRLHSSVELRPYQYDFVGWLDDCDEDARPMEPEREATMVLFWRSRSLAARRDRVSPVELQVIKAVFEGVPIDEALARQIGVPLPELAELLLDHHRAGIVIGSAGGGLGL